MAIKPKKKDKAKKAAKKEAKRRAREAEAAAQDPTEGTEEVAEEQPKPKKKKKLKTDAKQIPKEVLTPVMQLAKNLAAAGISVETWMGVIPTIENLSKDSLKILMDAGLGDLKTCGELMTHARKAAKMTQATLSEVSGIVQPHISSVERGKAMPTEKTLEAVSKALKMDADDLRGFDFGTSQPTKPRKRAAPKSKAPVEVEDEDEDE